jgi:outer membrane lipoprotein carrier protein
MNRKFRQILQPIFLLMCFAGTYPMQVRADMALEQLNSFISDLKTFEANFEQTLYDSDSQALKSSSGTVKLKRPGRFIWTYDEPEPQVLVADGERIWLYDKDLQQVTVNTIDDRISGSPLELLMRSGDLENSFDLTSLGEADDIRWVELKPKDESSDFELVFIGLDDQGLAAMELRDKFGQATQIVFNNFNAGITLDDSLFVFEAPEGVDIIGLDEQ